jgi:hypothetical protein
MIKQVIIITHHPVGDEDPGRVAIGFYQVINGMAVMCTEDGRPTGKRLAAGDDPDKVAKRLTREAWLRRGGESDFNRPLVYGPSRVA